MLIKLFISFFKIGLFSFGGGYAALALIQQEVVVENSWLAVGEFNDLITISQMTPGPIALNSATFVGQRVAGFPGSLAATIGCILPSAIIVGALSYFYKKYKDIDIMADVLKFLRPAIVVMILIAGLDILKTSLFDINPVAFENLNVKMLGLFIFSFLVMLNKDVDPIKIMILNGIFYLIISIVAL
ncbi:chromate transporter [Anaerococcus lactolyticus]|uniref:Chromate transporter n=3 Tax=Anaerococcus lactolyticus TaxID=33032 RepID=A0A095Y9I9_9FIRM|nr:chromate transporter [Anaerococcus lactolyticus]KGF03262.1 chromate transporter [Anaerococcus lactolyticus S7-1-13]